MSTAVKSAKGVGEPSLAISCAALNSPSIAPSVGVSLPVMLIVSGPGVGPPRSTRATRQRAASAFIAISTPAEPRDPNARDSRRSGDAASVVRQRDDFRMSSRIGQVVMQLVEQRFDTRPRVARAARSPAARSPCTGCRARRGSASARSRAGSSCRRNPRCGSVFPILSRRSTTRSPFSSADARAESTSVRGSTVPRKFSLCTRSSGLAMTRSAAMT